MSNKKMTAEKERECQNVLSSYPKYMQYAVEKLSNYEHDHYIQLTKELKENNCLWQVLTKGCLNALFFMMLIQRKITKICNPES